MQLINIGFGNIVSANRIITIVSPESAPIKRLIQESKDRKCSRCNMWKKNKSGNHNGFRSCYIISNTTRNNSK